MPWCEHCEQYRTPTSVTAEGTCPTCGHPIDPVERHQDARPDGAVDDGLDEDGKVPWHFKLMVVLLVAYLGWRLYQLVTGQL